MTRSVLGRGRNGCPAGKIRRKAYKTRRGVSVPSTCIEDQGAPGKGKKTLPKPKAGALRGYQTDMAPSRRREVLNKIARTAGCGEVVKRLNLIANFTKKSNPKAHRVYRSDMKYLQKTSRVCKLQKKSGRYKGGR